MSYHIIHILHHNSYLSVDQGFLVLKAGNTERRAPLSEIIIVIVSARGVSFSGNSLAEVIKNGGVILHCDEKYKPIGKTVGLSTVIHAQTFQRQIEKSETFNNKLWNNIIKVKIENQAQVLDLIDKTHKLWDYIHSKNYDEGNCARHYWKHYFSAFGKQAPAGRERMGAENTINQMLNYAYAVLSALCHRSIVAHGLHTSPGIHHKFRFKTDPLLYDLMEPLRPFCDLLLLDIFTSQPELTINIFAKEFSKRLVNLSLQFQKTNTKLIYAIDRYISSVAQCFYTGYVRVLNIPRIENIQT